MNAHTLSGGDVGPLSPPSGAIPGSTSAAKRSRKRRLSRLISLLNCCGKPDHADPDETEAPRPSSKKPIEPPASSSVAAGTVLVTEKTARHEPDSSRAEAQNTIEDSVRDSEKTAVSAEALSSDLQPSDRSLQRPDSADERKDGWRESGAGDDAPAPALLLLPEDSSPPALGPDLPAPPLLSVEPPVLPTAAATDGHEPTTADVMVIVQAPTPIMPSQDRLPASAEPPPTVDGSDLVMIDAPLPPSPPSAVTVDHHRQSQGPVAEDQPPPTLNLPGPPPPPIGDRTLIRPPSRNQPDEGSTTSEAIDPPPWLLPPRELRFNDRKCLVLDLDETLVHSSFKVGRVPEKARDGYPPPKHRLTPPS